jgi:hypothetical protein
MRALLTGLLVLGLVAVASAQVINGTFDDSLTGWTQSGWGSIKNPGDFGVPASPSGGKFHGTESSWGGSWDGPVGNIFQAVTGVTGAQTLSGELYAGAHSGDAWRNVAVDVLWNGVVVASLARDADPILWADGFSWAPFSVPVVGTGNDTLQVNYTIHFAEWTWTGVDNLAVTPEPAALALLVLGLPMLRRRR